MGKVATNRTVAKQRNRLASLNCLQKDEERQIGSQPWAVDAERAKDDNRHIVQVAIGQRQEFRRPLCRAVRAERRAQRSILSKRNGGPSSVNRRRRRQHEPLNGMRSRRFQQRQRSQDVGLFVDQRISDAGPHAGLRSQMHNARHVVLEEQAAHRLRVAKRLLEDRDSRIPGESEDVGPLDRRIVEGVEIVQANDRPRIACQQPLDEMAADKAGSAGDENRHDILRVASCWYRPERIMPRTKNRDEVGFATAGATGLFEPSHGDILGDVVQQPVDQRIAGVFP